MRMMIGVVTTEPEHLIIAMSSTIISAPKKLLTLEVVIINVAPILTSRQWMQPALGVRRTGQSTATVASVAADAEAEIVAEEGGHQ